MNSLISYKAEMAAILDGDTREGEDETENILNIAWQYAKETSKNPLHVARSLPHDYFGNDESEGASFNFFDKLLNSELKYDSSSKAGSESESESGPEKPECMQFIEFYLPGVCNSDSWDGTPIAAKLWDKFCAGWGEGLLPFVELARKHPGWYFFKLKN